MPRLTKKIMETTPRGPKTKRKKVNVGEIRRNKGPKAKFPDLSGDGKITMKDILIGRGVVKKKDGGLAEATAKLKAQGLKDGGPVKGIVRGKARGGGAATKGLGYNVRPN